MEKSVQIDPCRRENVTLFVEIRLTLGDEIKMTPVGILECPPKVLCPTFWGHSILTRGSIFYRRQGSICTDFSKPVVGTFLNKYAAISHTPGDGDFPTIRTFVILIFGDQSDLGMDYMQLLYIRPTQKLPILLLLSEERNTGKSTYPPPARTMSKPARSGGSTP